MFSAAIELHRTINPMDTFVVPAMACSLDEGKEFVKAIAWISFGQAGQCVNHLAVIPVDGDS